MLSNTARWISVILSPFIISIIILLAVTYVSSSGLKEFLIWVLIIIFFLVVLPIGYSYLKSIHATGQRGQVGDPTSYLRHHRSKVWFVGIITVIPCLLLLLYLKSPPAIMVTLFLIFIMSLAVAGANRIIKASFHIATVTTFVIIITALWGMSILPILIILPIIGWARYYLGHHTIIEMAVGFGIALVISIPVLYFSRLLPF